MAQALGDRVISIATASQTSLKTEIAITVADAGPEWLIRKAIKWRCGASS
jgi:hypothetical protein